VKKGDIVEVSLDGISERRYGKVFGNVISVDYDSIVNEFDGNHYYKVVISLEKTKFYYNGNLEVSLLPGLSARVKLKYSESTWMDLILDELIKR
jgi:hypothetical protein